MTRIWPGVTALCFLASIAHAQTFPVGPTPQWHNVGYSFYGEYGFAVSSAGDFNGDGYGDVLVGGPATNYEYSGGDVVLHYGGATGLSSSWTFSEELVGAQNGFSVTCAGDLNGDGYDDVAVGAPGRGSAYPGEGRIRVYFGRSARGPGGSWGMLGGARDAHLGTAVCGLGDVDGDGNDDFAAGAPGLSADGTARGGVHLLTGRGGTPTVVSTNVTAGEPGSEFGAAIAGLGDVDGDGYNDVLVAATGHTVAGVRVGAVYLFFGAPDVFAAAPGVTLTGDHDSADFGRTMALADLNGDGFSDVIVGAPRFREAGKVQVGRVFVYYSAGAGRTLEDPVVLANGPERFGHSISSLGDLDGDGREDMAVGANIGYISSSRNLAFIFMGKSSGVDATPSQILYRIAAESQFAAVVAGIGDVNGDGVNDLMLGNSLGDVAFRGETFVYYGNRLPDRLGDTPAAAFTPPVAGADFGRRVLNGGDVDGDGWDELVVTAPLDDGEAEDAGAAFIYRGSSAGWPALPTWTLRGRHVGAWFGESAAAVGDVDGDGFADVAVGAPHASGRIGDEGAVFVYYGGEAGLAQDSSFAAWGTQRGAALGCDVSWAGDVNGDGLSDIMIGASGFDDRFAEEGGVVVYYGNPYRLSALNAWRASGGQPGAGLGHVVSFAGDVNRDGFSDIVAGAPFYDAGNGDEGAVFVYHGSADGLPAEPTLVITGARAGARLGASLACAGDVDGDGFADVVAGAGNHTAAMADLGTAFLFRGAPGGLSTTPHWSAAGQITGGAFGHTVCGLGDIDGDGFSEFAVGDPLDDAGGRDNGRVSIFFGSATGPGTAPGATLYSDSDGGHFGRAIASAGDVNGDGGFDVLSGGAADGPLELYATGGGPGARVNRRVFDPARQRTPGPLAWSGQRGRADVTVTFDPAPGAATAGVEYQTRVAGGAWEPFRGVSTDGVMLAPQDRRAGETVSFDVPVFLARAGELYEWRVRPTSRHPLHRRSPWYYHATSTSGGPVIRSGEAPEVPPPPDDPPPPTPRPRFDVGQPFPNPFNPEVTVAFSLERRRHVTARIYSVRGALVRTLLDEELDEGRRELRWSGRDDAGNPAASGVYFLRIRADGREVIRRLVLVR